MDGPQQQQEPPWAAQVVLSVTGLPKADRAAIQELVERAGGRYDAAPGRPLPPLPPPTASCRPRQLYQECGLQLRPARTTALCRYSPNLSRRCTHLAVPGGVSERSEKLHSALRNRHKWGLHIVDLR